MTEKESIKNEEELKAFYDLVEFIRSRDGVDVVCEPYEINRHVITEHCFRFRYNKGANYNKALYLLSYHKGLVFDWVLSINGDVCIDFSEYSIVGNDIYMYTHDIFNKDSERKGVIGILQF